MIGRLGPFVAATPSSLTATIRPIGFGRRRLQVAGCGRRAASRSSRWRRQWSPGAPIRADGVNELFARDDQWVCSRFSVSWGPTPTTASARSRSRRWLETTALEHLSSPVSCHVSDNIALRSSSADTVAVPRFDHDAAGVVGETRRLQECRACRERERHRRNHRIPGTGDVRDLIRPKDRDGSWAGHARTVPSAAPPRHEHRAAARPRQDFAAGLLEDLELSAIRIPSNCSTSDSFGVQAVIPGSRRARNANRQAPAGGRWSAGRVCGWRGRPRRVSRGQCRSRRRAARPRARNLPET